MGKIKKVCCRCGSDDVTKDALAKWSNEDQRWELAVVLDSGNCDACGAELRYVNDALLEENDHGDDDRAH